jgi:hypothetical protein
LPCENPSCSQRGCTDKCRGIHIGSEASLGGSARIAGDHAGHYGMGFIDFVEMSGDSATFTLSSCNAGQHHLSLTYALGESADHPGAWTLTTVLQQLWPKRLTQTSVMLF